MGGRVRAVVPPARVPQALEQSLRIVLAVAMDEVNIPPDGFVQRLKDALL